MKPFSTRQKLFALVGLGTLAFVLVLFFVIRPLLRDLQLGHEEVQVQRITLNRLILEEQSYQRARADFTKIGASADEIEALFPPREELVAFVKDLEAIAETFENDFAITITDDAEEPTQSRGNSEKQASYTIVPGLSGIEVIPYSIKVTGDFVSVVKFLQTFEHQFFYSEIESFTISSVIGEGGQGGSGAAVRSG